ncbi:MAG TPA: outer membrane protein assembly factor BamE [Gammaproteobacteria bacterium]
MNNTRFVQYALIISLLSLLWSCTIHRMDIQQGNVLTQETLDKLVVGMEMRKVRGLAGTPLVADPFRSDRWDYVYSFKHGITKETQYSYVTLMFEKDILVDIKIHAEPLKREDINTLNRQLRELRS